MRINVTIFFNWLLILLVIFFTYQLLTTNTPWIFLDYVNLLIHEAGHLIFMPFGQFINILGGSLLQILFPFSFLLYFLSKKDYFSAVFIVFWIGNNIINVSVYMRDAIPMILPLLGGDGTIHDWHWLFVKMHLLNQSAEIGTGFFLIGVIFLFGSMTSMIIYTVLKMRRI